MALHSPSPYGSEFAPHRLGVPGDRVGVRGGNPATQAVAVFWTQVNVCYPAASMQLLSTAELHATAGRFPGDTWETFGKRWHPRVGQSSVAGPETWHNSPFAVCYVWLVVFFGVMRLGARSAPIARVREEVLQ
jgi:hypothetical protein